MEMKSLVSVILLLASTVSVYSAPAMPAFELQRDPANTRQRTAAMGLRPSAPNTQSQNELPGKIIIDLQGLQAPQTPSYYQAPMQQQPMANYAPQPYPAPAYYPQPPQAALPNLMSGSQYSAPNPCDSCNTCSLCATPDCSYCQSTCQRVTCGPPAPPPMPVLPKVLQPLWQQWNERTADMSRMEMAALIMSPAPKLPSAGTEEKETGSGENSGSASDEEMDDEDLYDAADKKSDVPKPETKEETNSS